ncbi:hypothetical protein K6119_09900 [Paracrocinitomix mangrovi]|uniref:tetratricopeptide repeat protein n=1 Tax=Paracrocinitomix mangrovi TaxID=2862509 RepID=UPI001C8CF736|nr:tetratricopeptide repeat protein [Paracrocinitomix mangrovi]UKN03803.1 hypothetical protein K6119_09900 [Paracrocinitomix mangrovi]
MSCNGTSSESASLSESDSLHIEELLMQSQNLSKSNQYIESIETCSEILSIQSANETALTRRAYAYIQLDSIKLSVLDYNHILLFNPNNKNALLNRGNLAYEFKHYEYAIQDFTSIIQKVNVFPDSFYLDVAHYMRGNCYKEIHEWNNAIIDFETAISLGFTSGLDMTFMKIGDCFEAISNYDSAIVYYSKSIEFSPEDHSLYNRRGIAYAESEQFDLALADYSKAIDLGGNWHSNRATVYQELGQLDKALQDVNTAIEITPINDWAYGNRASILLDMKRYHEAIPDFKTMLQYDTTAFLMYGLGKCYVETDNIDLALEFLQGAIELGSEEASSELEKLGL